MSLTKKGGVTVAIKRCKGCVFWQLYAGQTKNPVMRHITGEVLPKTKQHACQLVLRTIERDGEQVQVPVRYMQDVTTSDKIGPRFGERIGPNGSCNWHTAKHPPFVRPPRVQTHVGAEHTFEEGGLVPAIHNAMVQEKSAELATVTVTALV